VFRDLKKDHDLLSVRIYGRDRRRSKSKRIRQQHNALAVFLVQDLDPSYPRQKMLVSLDSCEAADLVLEDIMILGHPEFIDPREVALSFSCVRKYTPSSAHSKKTDNPHSLRRKPRSSKGKNEAF
jgi:hypothetical protein